jgi:acyl-CoA thioester hydrolase
MKCRQGDLYARILAVRYAETDAMGVVHHASYIVWFEVARTEWLAAQGYRYADLEKQGFFLVVAEVNARYLKPVRYGDPVVVRSHPTEVKSRAIRFAYEVICSDTGEVHVTGSTRHICTDRQGRVAKIPDYLMALITSS